MTTATLGTVAKRMKAKIDRLSEDHRYPERGYRKINDAVQLVTYMIAPILLPFILMYLQMKGG